MGTSAVDLPPLALIARLAALVPPPERHLVRYFGVLSSHAASRSDVVPAPAEPPPPPAKKDKPAGKSRYIPWAELLRRTFGVELLCSKCKGPLRLVALIKSEDIARKILTAMHLPTELPEHHPARPPAGSGPCRIARRGASDAPWESGSQGKKTSSFELGAGDLAIVLLAEHAAVLPRDADGVLPLLRYARVVDDPGFDGTVALELLQCPISGHPQDCALIPWRIRNEVMHRLVA